MLNTKKSLIGVLIVLLLIFVSCSNTQNTENTNNAQQPATVQSSKNKAIDFELTSLNGNKVKLSDLKGKVVVLNFFTTWCGYCKEEMPDFIDTMKKMKNNNNIRFLFIDVSESKAEVNKFVKERKYEIMDPLLDTKGEVFDAYGLSGFPTTFIIDKNGTVSYFQESLMQAVTLRMEIALALKKAYSN